MNEPPKPPENSASNGAGSPPARKAAVSSRLAQRQNPVAAALRGFGSSVLRIALRDPLALFLVLASIALAVTFGLLLGSIKPSSSGLETPLSTVQTLAKRHEIASAQFLDHDSRVEITTIAGAPEVSADGALPAPAAGGSAVVQPGGAGLQGLWAAYPASGAVTQQLASELGRDGASVSVDQQSGKATRTIIVQFLIPILLLVCLFSLFMRVGGEGAAGGLAAFSEFTGKGKKKGKGTRDKITFADV
jgi:cell division protease FtsH